MYGKGFLGNMTENLHADCVQSRQAGFMQRFLNAPRCCFDGEPIYSILGNTAQRASGDFARHLLANFSSYFTKMLVNTSSIHSTFCFI